MRLPRLAIEHPQFTIVVFFMMAWLGVNSYLTMPRTENPEVVVPGTLVTAIMPGASPGDMESLISDPIERALNELDYILRINTRITEGLSVTAVEFDFDTDADRKYDEVLQNISSIRNELPDELHTLRTWKWSTTDIVTLQIALTSATDDIDELDHYATLLKRLAERSDGVKKARILGLPEKEVLVTLDFARMAALNIPLTDIENAIVSSNTNIPAGNIDIGGTNISVKGSGQYTTIEEIENTVVASRGGELIRISDIATVRHGRSESDYRARYNGKPALFVTVTQKTGRNVFDVTGTLIESITPLINSLPPSVSVAYVFDQTEGVEAKINSFMGNLLQGILLVGVIVLLTIGVRSSMVVMLAIPLSVVAGIAIIDMAGFGLQQISIAGLVIALGLLVDNSIVMTENISRHIDRGLTPVEASVKAVSEIGWPVVAATITTLLAFIPISMMPGKAGAFIESLPVAIVATLSVSLLIALTLTPLITSRLYRIRANGKKPGRSPVRRLIQHIIDNPYRLSLRFALRNKWLTIASATLILLLTLLLVPGVGISFFPKAEQPNLLVTIEMPPGTAISKTDSLSRVVEKTLDTIPGISYTASNIGHGNPQIYYNIFPRSNDPALAEIFVKTDHYTHEFFAEITARTRRALDHIAGATVTLLEFEQGPPISAPVHLYISGPDINYLKELSEQVESVIRSHPGAVNISNSAAGSGTTLRLDINRDRANMYGVPLHKIDKTIRSLVTGLTVSHFRESDGNESPIILRGNDEESTDIFATASVVSLAGHAVPLLHLADLRLEETPYEINHYGLERTVQLRANLLPGYTADEVVAIAVAELEKSDLPPGYSYHIAGEIEGRNEAFEGMERALLAAILAILAILVLQFRSWRQPLIIFIAVPFAATGMIWALRITGYTFSFTAFIGLISLVGIVVNNSIILVDYANKLRREGMKRDEALQQAGEVRFLPILLTALTTIGGLLPLTLAGGTLWAPLGWTIIGGLLVSTFLTLIVVPVLYGVMERE